MEWNTRPESGLITKNYVSARSSLVGNTGKLLWQVQSWELWLVLAELFLAELEEC